MRFAVPQFIDVEDKIIGPLTLKQGIYVVGSVGITLAVFIKLGFFLAVLIGGPILFIAFMLSFVKIHGRPFINTLYSAFFYFTKNKLYLWKKTSSKKHAEKQDNVNKNATTRPVAVNMTQSKLKELAWTLDTNNMFNSKK